MNYNVDLRKIANAYYNRGLERAQLQDLSGAAVYLKRALHFDKYCTDARNLLGLIFFAMGETAEALVQWVISMNLQPDNNRADYYLDEIQRKPDVLEAASATVKRFNQALYIAQHDGEDFAIIELRDLTRNHPGFVKAQILLALLYMQNGEHIKAGRALLEVLKIDRNNPQALVLMDEVKHLTGRAEVENSKLQNAFSHRQLEDDDVILPKARRSASLNQVMICLVLGILLGLVGFYLLLLPSIQRGYRDELNRNIVQNSQELSGVNAAYSDLQARHAALEEEFSDVRQKLDAYEKENAEFTSMYEKLNSITESYMAGEYEEAAASYLEIDREYATQEPLLSQLQEVDRFMLNDAFDQIVSKGTANWNGGNKAEAERYYKLALQVKSDDPEAMYLLARLLQSEDRITEANAIFDRIVGEHPESSYAQRSIDARGY